MDIMECHRFLINRFLKNNGLPIHDPPAFQGAPPAQNQYPNWPENIVMPSYKYSDHVPAAAEVQPVNVMQHVPSAWSLLPDMEQISYDMLTYPDVYLDQVPMYSYNYNHLQLPAPQMNPSMQPAFPALPEDMFMHVPRADTYMKQRYDTLKRDAVPIHSGLVQLPTYFNDHVELPAAELNRAIQPVPPAPQELPALPLQQVPPAPQELPVPPVPPPPVRGKREERWTIEEHKSFLRGLRRYDRGDWRSISRIYVPSKTPTQIASHAQKYYLRQTSKKKRKSIHDTVLEEEELNQALLPHHHGAVANAMVEEPHQVLLPHN